MTCAWQVYSPQPATALMADLATLIGRQEATPDTIPQILHYLGSNSELRDLRLQLREDSRPANTSGAISEPGCITAAVMAHGDCLGELAATVPGAADPEQARQLLQVAAVLIGQTLRLCPHWEGGNVEPRKTGGVLGGERDGARATYGILGRSVALQDALHQARRAAASHAPIMLNGESGTGKERFARMIHLASDRHEQPFVCLNCANVPENLLESELFGHEKGSFTGATGARAGKFELASGGTLFLDEIGEMSLSLQAKLLRVLQEQVIQRIGSNRDTRIDVRIITATHRNLESAVNVCTFRLDLYYRLNVIRIPLPALRERGSDIRLLASYFLSRENQRYGRNVVLLGDAMRLLENYAWPGNVRQLENVMTRLVIMSDSEGVSREQMEKLLQEESAIDIDQGLPASSATAGAAPLAMPLRPYFRVDDQERERICDALRLSRGNKTSAAQYLGLSVRQLHYRVRKLGIS